MKELLCNIHYIRSKKQDYIIIVGVDNHKIPRIVFADRRRGRQFLDAQTGKLKLTRSTASLVCDNDIKIEDLQTDFNGVAGLVCRLISVSLEYDTPLPRIISVLRRSHADLGLETALIRVLKYYQSLIQRSDDKKNASVY